jgi:hypothetical protein
MSLNVGTVSAISPTISNYSFDMVFGVEPSHSYDSDDEIVWSVSERSEPVDDFVLLSRPQSALAGCDRTALSTPVEDNIPNVIPTPATVTRSLVVEMQKLIVGGKSPKIAKVQTLSTPPMTPKKKNKKRGRIAESYPASPVKGTSTTILVAPSPSKKKQRKKKKKAAAAGPSTFGLRKVVDGTSDRQSLSVESDSVTEPSIEWQEAATFISSYVSVPFIPSMELIRCANSFLSNPAAQANTVCRLTLLQSIIIELGLGASSSLPPSLTAAKAFLKSRAFLNIREYVAIRGQGPKAVQSLLFPSRSALVKDIRKKRNPASLKWVKKHGLQVLLVGWMQ